MSELMTIDNEVELIAPPVELEDQDFNSFLATARALPQMEVAVSIVPKYFEFESIGQSVRGVFLGFLTVHKKNDDGELVPLPCVQWMDAAGAIYINAGTTLLQAFNSFTPHRGTPVEITYAAKNKNTKVYDVKLLRPVAEDPAEKEALIRNLYDTAKVVLGYTSKEEVLQHCSHVLQREVRSASQLSLMDINTVLAYMDSKPPF